MKYVFLNLKRFDVPAAMGGVNRMYDPDVWGRRIIEEIQGPVGEYADSVFAAFLPEAQISGAKAVLRPEGNLSLGCQSVHFADIDRNGNFGAFTTSLPATAAAALGCGWTIIGHCEERNKIKGILREGDGDCSAVNRILGRSLKCALDAGLRVLYCVGENEDELPMAKQVLKEQLESVLPRGGSERIVVAYEPVWAIGPGKTPPQAEYIANTARYIKSIAECPVVYGGGLKSDNASMLAGIDEIDGGLIALTRFTGDIGFYPDEYIEIVKNYLE